MSKPPVIIGNTIARGPKGEDGNDGPAGTIAIGTVADAAEADVRNTGTAQAAVLDFDLPRSTVPGPAGPDTWHELTDPPSDAVGSDGDWGMDPTGKIHAKEAGSWVFKVDAKSTEPGPAGDAATIAVGTVTETASADVRNTGTSSAAVLDFDLPRGSAGVPGPPGPLGFGVETTVSSGTYTLNPSVGTDYTLTAAGNFSLATSNLGFRQSLYVELIQDGTGGRVITMPSDWEEVGTVTLSTTADTYDALVIYRTPMATFVKQVIAGAALPSGFWSPEQLADKSFYHNAAALPLEDGETLTGWDDDFGRDDLVTVEGSPTMKVLNGEKYVQFTSVTSDALLSNGPPAATTTPLTVVFLARINGAGTQPVMDDANALSGLEIYGRDNPQNWGINSSDPNTMLTNGEFQIMIAHINGASGWVRVDGTQENINTGGKYITTSGRILGRNQPNNAWGDVDIARAFAFGHEPDAQELADIEAMLTPIRDTLNG